MTVQNESNASKIAAAEELVVSVGEKKDWNRGGFGLINVVQRPTNSITLFVNNEQTCEQMLIAFISSPSGSLLLFAAFVKLSCSTAGSCKILNVQT